MDANSVFQKAILPGDCDTLQKLVKGFTQKYNVNRLVYYEACDTLRFICPKFNTKIKYLFNLVVVHIGLVVVHIGSCGYGANYR